MVASILPLTVSGAMVRRGGRTILGPLDWHLDGSGLTMLLGPNGSGKTTMLRLLHGLDRLRAGTVQWSAPQAQVRAAQSFVFQTPIVMRRSVIDNIAYPLIIDGNTRDVACKKAAEQAARVGLQHRLDVAAQVLSGGEKQKMALARALIRAPQVLFLDEPCANLDMHATRDIEAILADARDRGTCIVMATHNFGQARRLADSVVFLNDGQIVESGSAAALLNAPKTLEFKAFLNGDLLL